MRPTISCVGLLTASIMASVPAFAVETSSVAGTMSGSSSKLIFGLANAKHFKSPSDGNFYVQAATFKTASKAENYKHYLTNKFHQPVTVKTSGNYHVVMVGPVHSVAEVRALGGSTKSFIKNTPVVTSEHKPIDLNRYPATTRRYFEIIGAGSLSTTNQSNAFLGVTSNETDTLVQTNSNAWNSWGGQLGLGYVYFLRDAQEYSEHVQWFPMVEPQVNVYYNRYQNKGDVYRFGSADFNDFTYDMPINNTRLMLDGALTVASWRELSTYVKAGIGNAWSNTKYSDSDSANAPCTLQNLALNGHDSSNFVWEVGAGETYAFNDKVKLSLEYLYTDYGRLSTAAGGSTGSITTPVLSAARFGFSAQGLLLGLHVKI